MFGFYRAPNHSHLSLAVVALHSLVWFMTNFERMFKCHVAQMIGITGWSKIPSQSVLLLVSFWRFSNFMLQWLGEHNPSIHFSPTKDCRWKPAQRLIMAFLERVMWKLDLYALTLSLLGYIVVTALCF